MVRWACHLLGFLRWGVGATQSKLFQPAPPRNHSYASIFISFITYLEVQRCDSLGDLIKGTQLVKEIRKRPEEKPSTQLD